ncbi:hypothetical protein ACOSQ3_007121 [Xanthoceras sorbifolium]
MSLDVPWTQKGVWRYLMEFSGEILLVLQFLRDKKETYHFTVYRLDFERMACLKLDSLGDYVAFVGRNSSRIFFHKDIGVDMTNCIYCNNEFEHSNTKE